MLRRRAFFQEVVLTTVAILTGCTGGGTTTAHEGLSLQSNAFTSGGALPVEYTADGANRSPPLSVSNVPERASTLALTVIDVDAEEFVHWLLWHVPADIGSIPAGVPPEPRPPALAGARQGTNDFGTIGYRGPAPPAEDGPHTYRFSVFALDRSLPLQAGATRQALSDTMAGSVLASDRITATYDR